MKKILTMTMLLAVLAANSQDLELTEQGAYELKQVVMVDSTSAAVLYDRAMMALSDLTGADGKATAGIDYQNQETHTVIYKGRYSLGFKNTFLGDGWNRYAEFSLKVRCKDGRAQVTITVPTVTGIYSKGNITRQNTVGELAKAVMDSRGNKHERGEALINNLVETADGLAKMMCDRLKINIEDSDDDF